MLYFKYNTTFRKVSSIEHLLENKKIDYILSEEDFYKLLRKGHDLYCFIDPYKSEIDGVCALNWNTTEEDALDLFFLSQEEI